MSELFRFKGRTNRLRAICRRRRPYRYPRRRAVVNAVVIRAVRNAAADLSDVLRNVVE